MSINAHGKFRRRFKNHPDAAGTERKSTTCIQGGEANTSADALANLVEDHIFDIFSCLLIKAKGCFLLDRNRPLAVRNVNEIHHQ